MGRYGEVYADTRKRLTELVRSLGPDDLARRVPASPEWTVQDVVAHVTGIVSDALDGNVAGTGSDEWTAKQVESRRGRPLGDVLGEWETKATQLEAAIDDFGPAAGGGLVQDVFVHEQDIRHAVGRPGGRDSDALWLALDFNMERLRRRIAKHGLPALRVRAGDREWVLGEGEPQATLTADPFELARATGGRRTPDQIRALGWDGDPSPWLAHISMYAHPAEPLGE